MYLYDADHCARCFIGLDFDKVTYKNSTQVYQFKCPKCKKEYLTDHDTYLDIKYRDKDED